MASNISTRVGCGRVIRGGVRELAIRRWQGVCDRRQGRKAPGKTIARTQPPQRLEFYRGALYVATAERVIRFDNIEANLDNRQSRA